MFSQLLHAYFFVCQIRLAFCPVCRSVQVAGECAGFAAVRTNIPAAGGITLAGNVFAAAAVADALLIGTAGDKAVFAGTFLVLSVTGVSDAVLCVITLNQIRFACAGNIFAVTGVSRSFLQICAADQRGFAFA